MRRRARYLAVVCVVAGALAVLRAADVLSQLGIPPESAREAVTSVLNGALTNPGLPAKAFKLAPPSARAEMAMGGMAWLKSYAASAEFRQAYAAIRANNKPAAPPFDGTPEEELQKGIDEAKAQQEESKKAIASLPPEQRKPIEETLQAAQATIAQMETPEMRKTRLEAIRTARADRTKQYEQELQNWKRDYPESASPLIAKRLREFLALSADVDFTAATRAKDRRMVFENATYEQKPAQWKMCYRAGKEATSIVRAAAQAWLKELGG